MSVWHDACNVVCTEAAMKIYDLYIRHGSGSKTKVVHGHVGGTKAVALGVGQ